MLNGLDNNIKPRAPLAHPTGHTASTVTGFISTGGYQASNTIYTLQISYIVDIKKQILNITKENS